MPERRRVRAWSWAPVAAFVVVLVLVMLAKGIGFLTADATEVTSTPIVRSQATAAPALVDSAQATCITGVVFGPDTARAVLQAFGPLAARPGPALELTARAGGYVARGRQAAGYADGAVLSIPFAPPDRERAGGTLCLRAVGGRSASLRGGASGRDLAAETTLVAGTPAPVQLSVTLTAAQPGSLLGRAGQLLDRASFLRPGIFGSVLLTLLTLLVAIGVPVAVGVAVARAGREARS